MMAPLQTSAIGRSVALLFFAGAMTSIVVGAFVGYRAFRAYRRTQRRQLLPFSLGLLLLVSVSKLANVVLASASAPGPLVGPVTELLRLGGAVIVAYAIYDR